MGTHVIIDARKRKARATLEAPGKGTTIFAVDLIGDTWEDFRYFSEQAAYFERKGELQRRNRYVRAAIAFLFSHLDGIVSALFGALREEASFAPYLPSKPNFCSLKTKMSATGDYLSQEKGASLPTIDFNMKLLRDIVNHPSVTKEAKVASSNDTLLYEGVDVYGIAVEDLEATAREIDQWLNAACEATGYERFCDTKRLCEEFVSALKMESGPISTF